MFVLISEKGFDECRQNCYLQTQHCDAHKCVSDCLEWGDCGLFLHCPGHVRTFQKLVVKIMEVVVTNNFAFFVCLVQLVGLVTLIWRCATQTALSLQCAGLIFWMKFAKYFISSHVVCTTSGVIILTLSDLRWQAVCDEVIWFKTSSKNAVFETSFYEPKIWSILSYDFLEHLFSLLFSLCSSKFHSWYTCYIGQVLEPVWFTNLSQNCSVSDMYIQM